jgi:tellurite resistance protein TehA-like permease
MDHTARRGVLDDRKAAGRASRLLRELDENVRTLHPAAFALVMATGIVSLACRLLGQATLAYVLFGINAGAYLALWTLLLLRLARHRHRLLADFIDHSAGPGFFTVVAAGAVLGSQCVLLFGAFGVATVLWVFSVVLWCVLTYGIFTALIVKQDKPSIARGINGGWLLAVVSTQSIAVLSALLAPHAGTGEQGLLLCASAMWLFGGMLYIWIISLIFYRYSFFTFSPEDLSPPYWINMGAVAISALAGTLLMEVSHRWVLLADLRPFLKGFTLLYWSTGTWWIPMLLILGCWRHIYRRYPLEYSPLYWGAVFPLGMYTVCTWKLAVVADLPMLMPVPRVLVYVALAAWTAVFVGLLRSLWRRYAPIAARAEHSKSQALEIKSPLYEPQQ